MRPCVRRENDMKHKHTLDLSFLDDTPAPAKPAPVATAWDTQTALTLMDDADAAVERYGSHGRDSRIQALVMQVIGAHKRRDMASLTAACSLITERSKEMANHTTVEAAA